LALPLVACEVMDLQAAFIILSATPPPLAPTVIVGSSTPLGGLGASVHLRRGVLQGEATRLRCLGGGSEGRCACVFPSECMAGSEVSWMDHQASGSSSLPPQQGGLEAVHSSSKVMFLVSPARRRFLWSSLHCCCSSRSLRFVRRIPSVCLVQRC
jgi:hypothetical protein